MNEKDKDIFTTIVLFLFNLVVAILVMTNDRITFEASVIYLSLFIILFLLVGVFLIKTITDI